MTQKQFKQILTDANLSTDLVNILISLERLARLDVDEYTQHGLQHAAEYSRKQAQAIHNALENAGIFDGFEDEVNKALA